MIISRSALFGMRNASDKFIEKIETHIFSESLAVYEIMWKNMVELGRPQMSYNTESAFCMLHTLDYKHTLRICIYKKGKIPPATGRGGPGRLRPRIFVTFGTTRVVGRQPYTPAAFTTAEIHGTHFQRLSRTQGT